MAPGDISSKPDSSPFEGPDGERRSKQLLYITREEHRRRGGGAVSSGGEVKGRVWCPKDKLFTPYSMEMESTPSLGIRSQRHHQIPNRSVLSYTARDVNNAGKRSSPGVTSSLGRDRMCL